MFELAYFDIVLWMGVVWLFVPRLGFVVALAIIFGHPSWGVLSTPLATHDNILMILTTLLVTIFAVVGLWLDWDTIRGRFYL